VPYTSRPLRRPHTNKNGGERSGDLGGGATALVHRPVSEKFSQKCRCGQVVSSC
jgi:hypothetical protein